MKTAKNLSFEEQLSILEGIVEKMERGGISLEESMALYEQGMKVEKILQKQLEESTQRMTILMNQGGQVTEKPFVQENE